jgi:hypothetical protein
MIAVFHGGPLDGESRQLPNERPPSCLHFPVAPSIVDLNDFAADAPVEPSFDQVTYDLIGRRYNRVYVYSIDAPRSPAGWGSTSGWRARRMSSSADGAVGVLLDDIIGPET